MQHTEQRFSAEIQEIIEVPPNWILNWGPVILLIALVISCAVLGFVKSPVTLKVTLVLRTSGESAMIYCPRTSRVTKVFVSNNEVVKTGEDLVELQDSLKQLIVLKATQPGRIKFRMLLYPHATLNTKESIIEIVSTHQHFTGEAQITEEHIADVRAGQKALIWLRGHLNPDLKSIPASLGAIADVRLNHSEYLAELKFNDKNEQALNQLYWIKDGTRADGEIVISEISLLEKMIRISIPKIQIQ